MSNSLKLVQPVPENNKHLQQAFGGFKLAMSENPKSLDTFCTGNLISKLCLPICYLNSFEINKIHNTANIML